MRHAASYSVLCIGVLALGCTKGQLIDSDDPGTPEPPTQEIPVLALRIGGTGIDDLTDILADPAGNLYVAGTFTGAVDFDPGTAINSLVSLGATDAFVAKYSASGALIWVARIGGTGTESATALARDASGNLVLSGGFDGTTDFDPGPGGQFLLSLGAEDGYVARLSSDGALLWARRFGGGGSDRVEDVTTDATGNVYAAGIFAGDANALPTAGPTVLSFGGVDGFLLSFDPTGAVRWVTPIGGPDNDEAHALTQTTDGAIVVAGSFRGTADFAPGALVASLTSVGGSDAFVASYSTVGALRWNKALSGTADQEVRNGGIASGPGGSVAVSGSFAGTVDLNPGTATSFQTSRGPTDWFVDRLDTDGTFEWAFAVGGTGADKAPRPTFDADGTLLLVGSFTGPVDFDPGSASHFLTSLTKAGSDAFAARYAPGGGLLWIIRFGEATSVVGRNTSAAALAGDLSGNLLVAGQFFGSPDFDPGATAFRLLSLGDADGFVVELTAAGALAIAP